MIDDDLPRHAADSAASAPLPSRFPVYTATLAGTKVACTAVVVEGSKALSCYVYNAKGPLPRSYGVGITDGAVAVLRYDAARNYKVVLEREHRK